MINIQEVEYVLEVLYWCLGFKKYVRQISKKIRKKFGNSESELLEIDFGHSALIDIETYFILYYMILYLYLSLVCHGGENM